MMLRLTSWLHDQADHANPMLVRRVRQELRNRAFIGAYLLMLLIAVIAASIAAAASSQAGRGLFAAVGSAWVVLMCLQALATSRAIAGDRGAASWDLIELSGMPPMHIVTGVVQSSLVLGLLGAAGLAPFLVMSYLLRGLDLPTVVFALITLPMAGALLGATAAMFSCIGNSRQARQGLGLVLALGLVTAWILLTTVWASSEQGLSRWLAEVMRGDGAAILALIGLLNAWIVLMALAFVLAAALLTHRALDRSSGPRLVWLAIWFNGLLWLGTVMVFAAVTSSWHSVSSDLEEVMAVASTIGVCWGLILGLFAVTEDTDITPRQLQSTRTGGRLRRAAMTVLGPGAGRGTRCTLLIIGLSLLLCAPWLPDTPALILACHGLFVLTVGDLVARGPLSRFCPNPQSRRICTVAMLVVLGLAPALIALFLDGSEQRLLLALSPFTGPVDLFNHSGKPSGSLGGWLVMALGLASCAWLLVRAMRSGTGQARVTANEDDANPRS